VVELLEEHVSEMQENTNTKLACIRASYKLWLLCEEANKHAWVINASDDGHDKQQCECFIYITAVQIWLNFDHSTSVILHTCFISSSFLGVLSLSLCLYIYIIVLSLHDRTFYNEFAANGDMKL
jgi:hypothetical protein